MTYFTHERDILMCCDFCPLCGHVKFGHHTVGSFPLSELGIKCREQNFKGGNDLAGSSQPLCFITKFVRDNSGHTDVSHGIFQL